jgi:GxxExxY protein
MVFNMMRERLNVLGAQIRDACITVHKELGPGLLESAYVYSLKTELGFRGIIAETSIRVPLFYKGHDTGKYYEIDLLVENEIIIEAKAVEILHPVHKAQIISYLKLTGKRLGYLVNFNVVLMKDGFNRVVNGF